LINTGFMGPIDIRDVNVLDHCHTVAHVVFLPRTPGPTVVWGDIRPGDLAVVSPTLHITMPQKYGLGEIIHLPCTHGDFSVVRKDTQ